jgi:hypothetical protein
MTQSLSNDGQNTLRSQHEMSSGAVSADAARCQRNGQQHNKEQAVIISMGGKRLTSPEALWLNPCSCIREDQTCLHTYRIDCQQIGEHLKPQPCSNWWSIREQHSLVHDY